MANKIKITQLCNCSDSELPLGTLAISEQGNLYSIVGVNGSDVMFLKLNPVFVNQQQYEKLRNELDEGSLNHD